MWGAIASVGISALSALSSSNASSRAARQADAQQRAAMEAQKAELDFAKEQYADWQRIFGPIQENLSEFYQNLTPDLLETQGLEAIERERARITTQLDANLAQRGISQSGVAAQAQTDIAMQTAEQRAQVRAHAPMQAAQQQLGFLQVGLGQNPQGILQQALGRNSNAQTDLASRFGNQAFQASQSSQQAFMGLGNSVIDLIGQFGTGGGD